MLIQKDKIKRRKFINKVGLASAGLLVPSFLYQSCKTSEKNEVINYRASSNKKLIVIQLSGGNDGLNSIVPFNNDIYHRLRPSIALKKEELFYLQDEAYCNAALTPLRSIIDRGWMTVINSVGYPNPNLSHFLSTDIWQTAGSGNKTMNTGWIGRYLDSECNNCHLPYNAIELDDSLSLALKGSKYSGFAMRDLNALSLTNAQTIKLGSDNRLGKSNETLDYLYKTWIDTKSSISYLHEQVKQFNSKESYPDSEFGKRMKQVSDLIKSDIKTQIYYTSQSGYDTHNNQKGKQYKLLRDFSSSISALIQDLEHNHLFDDVLIMIFSEFGRRVQQNASKGTDHGTANNVFLFSKSLPKPGLFNSINSMNNLIGGNLVFDIDFRQVYTTVLEDWLGIKADNIITSNFKKLPFLV